ncbi:MAG: sigma 54-interacting transcriptional regulator [Candidatus Eisenbacteria bacterium]|nr:sigma 54-interacting transcriptional regulator [Candidatus Eisenbacteria bacterium]
MDVFRDKSRKERACSEPSDSETRRSFPLGNAASLSDDAAVASEDSAPSAADAHPGLDVRSLRDIHPAREGRSVAASEAVASALMKLVGRSREMLHVHELIKKIALCDTTVLIEGETGTGKELVAKAIHQLGRRRGSNFLAHNCGATPDTLIESELFGHVKGAFTGAVQDKKGLFEVADGGTFFLDEIADISSMMQIKLLRVLQEREFRRVGETQARRIDVRVIAATNRDLLGEVEQGRFRRDLYYRLGVIKLRLPALRERRDDIPALVEHFLAIQARRIGARTIAVRENALEVLRNYDWPGNVRELENEMERAVALGHPGTEVTLWGLSDAVRSNSCAAVCDLGPAGTLKYETDRLERQRILEALESSMWNKTRAAKALGLSRQGLLKKMRRFKLGNGHTGPSETTGRPGSSK